MASFDRTSYTRRAFLRGAAQSSALLAAGTLPGLSAEAPTASTGSVDPTLAAFIAHYMQTMHAPGMTLALVHADGKVDTAGFGLSDVAATLPVSPAMLFEIGSISKSFCALALLQMRDEGKLDLQRPILDYLPWLPLTMNLGPATVHHLLTHSAGLTHSFPLFQMDPDLRIPQTSKPGTQFAYSNLGYEILGFLAEKIDGKTYPSILRSRLLDPLGMHATRPGIYEGIWAEETRSYTFFRDDLANTPASRLAPAPGDIITSAEGCIASTPADMALYLKMLLAHGSTPSGRIVSEAGFGLFSTPYFKAPELGPTLSYGYGVAIDTIDGHKTLIHTGGMRSFASAFHANLDARVAAFASINAMQGYRPLPVTRYAVETLRAQSENKPAPAPPTLPNPLVVENAADYAGEYTGGTGKLQGKLRIVAEGKSLFLIDMAGSAGSGARIPLEGGGDSFTATEERWQAFTLEFQREKGATPDTPGKVTELLYGPHWYVTAAYQGPRSFPEPPNLRPFAGTYTDGQGISQVYFSKGELLADGVKLEQISEALFRPTSEPNSPDRLHFLHVVDGKARMVAYNGYPSQRIEIG